MIFLTPLQQLHSDNEEDEKVINALIFSQLDSSFLTDTESLARLRLVRNAAVMLLAGFKED